MKPPQILENRIFRFFVLILIAVLFGYAAFDWYVGVAILTGLIIAWALLRRREVGYLILLTLFVWGGVILHPLVMFIYVNPAVIEALLIASAVVAFIYFRYLRNEPRDKAVGVSFTFVMATAIPLIILFGVLGGVYTQEHLAAELDVNGIETLPNLDTSQLRVLPKMVGARYIEDATQYPRLTPWDQHLVLINGTPHWVSVLSPDGFVNSILLNAGGVAGVDATIMEKNSFVVEQELSVAPGRFFIFEPWYKAIEHDYWADYEYEYPVIHDGEVYLVVPKITYSYEFRFPALYTVPQWGGLLLIDGDGQITELTPQEAAESEILAGQRLFPECLSRTYIDALNYELGAVNVWFMHEEQFEIIDVTAQGNRQPFLVKTNDSLEWVFACKPYGETTQGIFKVFLLDARTGEIDGLRLSETSPLLGPVASAEYVIKELPLVDWWSMQAVEPIPVIIENSLYWEIRIVPNTGAGVAYIVAVDSGSGNVSVFETADEFRNFVISGAWEPGDEPAGDIAAIMAELRDLIAELEERLNELESLYGAES